MTDHPSTFNSTTTASGEAAWQDRASIVPATQAEQMDGGVPLLRGTFADMILHMTRLPDEEREGYVIKKAGDRVYGAHEAMALASHPDFPAQGPD